MTARATFRAWLFLAAVAVVFTACSKGTPDPGPTQIGATVGVAVDPSHNVYINGLTGTQTGTTSSVIPSCWINGTLSEMCYQPNTYFWTEWNAVDSSHMYVAGASNISADSPTPVCWRDTSNMVFLPMGGSNTYGLAYNVAMDGSGNVYVTGKVGTSSSAVAPCYWVNNAFYSLSFGSTGYTYGYAIGIAFDGSGSTYIAGRIGSSSSALKPCYWVATASSQSGPYMLNMNGSNTYGVARNIAISGTTVYISGIEGPSSTSVSMCYWKGTTASVVTSLPTDLPTGTGNTDWTLNWAAVDASGEFYIVGDVGTGSSFTPSYWEITGSGAPPPVSLPTGQYGDGDASGIAFDGSSVYVAGTLGSQVPCYWKNGALNILTIGSSKNIQSARSSVANRRDLTFGDSGHQGPQ